MDIILPKFVESLPIGSGDLPYGDRMLSLANMLEAEVIPVQDILMKPNLEIRTIWQKLGHVKLWEAYNDPDKTYARDNPVIHIKCLDAFWLPKLQSDTRIAWDGDVLCSSSGLSGDWSSSVLRDGCLLIWSENTTVQEGSIVYFANTYLRGDGKLAISRLTAKYAGLYNPSSQRRIWQSYDFGGWTGDLAVVGKPGGPLPDRWDLIGRKLRENAQWSQYESSNFTRMFDFEAGADRDELVDKVHAEMRRALRYNEEALFRGSGKKNDLAHLESYPLQVALGDAWDQCLTPHGDPTDPDHYNPGLSTFGFNNLQNLRSVIDGLLLLASAKGLVTGVAEALDDAVFLKTSESHMYARLAAKGRRSKYAMTHDPDWFKLTPMQQRRFVRKADITALEKSVTASAALTPISQPLPDWASRIENFDYHSFWFFGRYVWSTGWHDYEQAHRYIQYQMRQAMDPTYINPTLHGRTMLDDDVTVRVSFKARERALTGLANLLDKCFTMGVAPTSAVMWDLIPFSFVVDWFFPVGEGFDAQTKNIFYAPEYYEYYDGFCCSLKYKQRTSAGFNVQCYTRWYQGNCPQIDLGHTVIEGGHTPSFKTTAFRFVDGCALLFRR